MAKGDVTRDELLRVAKFLRFGFYRVTYDGKFIECDSKAREIFGIPEGEEDVSKYSIRDLYVDEWERERRLEKLEEDRNQTISGTLSIRIGGKNKLIFDICWCEKPMQEKCVFTGLTSDVTSRAIFSEMFDEFPMGLYEFLEDEIVRVNKKMLDILGFRDTNEILGRNINAIFEKEDDLERFYREMKRNRYAHDILRMKGKENKVVYVECFTFVLDEFENAGWGMVNDVTKQERYYRALDRMPTGYYYIENERITQCNSHFAWLMGFEKKEDAIGIDIRNLYLDRSEHMRYLPALREADESGRALLAYPLGIKKINDGEIIYVSIDSHLVKDSNGNVIGREGTVRDVTKEIKLKNQVEAVEESLIRTTADINKLIHTFLHPVVKFTGNTEYLSNISNILRKTTQSEIIHKYGPKKRGKILLEKLNDLKGKLSGIEKIGFSNDDEFDPLVASGLNEKLTQITIALNYSLQNESSSIFLDTSIADTALRVLEELNRIGYIMQERFRALIEKDFIVFLQGILLDFMEKLTWTLAAETKVMKQNIESLRGYIGMRQERKYVFEMRDIGDILEHNIKLFKPVLAEKGIEIEYKKSGNLTAQISRGDINRVVSNLLQNAYKYSHRGRGRFVIVRTQEIKSGNMVEFSIKNLGVPIKEKEIVNGDIWKFGYRGELAYSSDRGGTGVGLADTYDVISAHNGRIFITSVPSTNDGDPPKYKVPYITTITVQIPRNQTKRQEK